MSRRKILVADLLCGAGGSSTGCARAQIAWAAAIIEGEGSIHVSMRSQRAAKGVYLAHRVRVVMSDRDVIERLPQIFGVGRVSAYRTTQGLGKKQLYLWEANKRQDVIEVCNAIYQWMGRRRRSRIDQLRALLSAHPPVSGSERARRTWVTRRANARKLAAKVEAA